MVNHVGSTPLHEALSQSVQAGARGLQLSQELSDDKMFVGALDSACNRTCCGVLWLGAYMKQVNRLAPSWISELIESVDETERFKFGNGGVVASEKRWRLPCCVGGRVLLLWVSVVPVASLGCLLGRDFLDAVGAILDFANRSLECTFLQSDPQRLKQMSAGHFMLPLIPETWPRLDVGSWRKCGLDNIIELQMSPKVWLKRKLSEGVAGHPKPEDHEHLVIETGVDAGVSSFRCHEILFVGRLVSLAHQMTQPFVRLCGEHPLRPLRLRDLPVCDASGRRRQAFSGHFEQTRPADPHDGASLGLRHLQVEALHLKALSKASVVCGKLVAMAVLAFLFALLAISIPFDLHGGELDSASPFHGESRSSCFLALGGSFETQEIQCRQFGGYETLPRSCGLASCIPGRRAAADFSVDEIHAWTTTSLEGCSDSRVPGESAEGDREPRQRGPGETAHRSERWSSFVETRFDTVGPLVEPASRVQGHCGNATSQSPAVGGDFEAKANPEDIYNVDYHTGWPKHRQVLHGRQPMRTKTLQNP